MAVIQAPERIPSLPGALILAFLVCACSSNDNALSETEGVEIVDLESASILNRAWYLNSFDNGAGEILITQASTSLGLSFQSDGQVNVLTSCAELPTTYSFISGVMRIEPVSDQALLCGNDLDSSVDRERFSEIFLQPIRLLSNGIGLTISSSEDMELQLINPHQILISERWSLASFTKDNVNRLAPVSGTRYSLDFTTSGRTSGIFECTSATTKYMLLDNVVELSELGSDDVDCTIDVNGYLEQTMFISRFYNMVPLTVNYFEGGLVLSTTDEERLYFK